MPSDDGQKEIMWRVSERVSGLVRAARESLKERDGVEWSQTKTIEYMLIQAAKAMGLEDGAQGAQEPR